MEDHVNIGPHITDVGTPELRLHVPGLALSPQSVQGLASGDLETGTWLQGVVELKGCR